MKNCSIEIDTDETDYDKATELWGEKIECPNQAGRTRYKIKGMERRDSDTDKIVFGYSHCGECQKIKRDEQKKGQWKEWGLPDSLLTSDFTNFLPQTDSQRKALELSRDFAKRKRGFLILHGDPGVGKDHLSVAIGKCHSEFRWAKHHQMIMQLRSGYTKRTADKFITSMCEVPMLIVSEIGLSVGGKDEYPFFYEVLSYRSENFLPTILNSNLSIDLGSGMSEINIMDGRLFSRIRGAIFAVQKMEGPDWRANNRKEYFKDE